MVNWFLKRCYSCYSSSVECWELRQCKIRIFGRRVMLEKKLDVKEWIYAMILIIHIQLFYIEIAVRKLCCYCCYLLITVIFADVRKEKEFPWLQPGKRTLDATLTIHVFFPQINSNQARENVLKSFFWDSFQVRRSVLYDGNVIWASTTLLLQ